MGYACPVCDAPQADGEHLANHLAFSALLGHDDHEAWLDERVPAWGDTGPEELAEQVTPHVEPVDYPAVEEGDPVPVEDPTAHPGGVERTQRAPGAGELDEAAREVLEEARRMTEAGQEEGGEDAGGESDDGEGDGGGNGDEDASE